MTSLLREKAHLCGQQRQGCSLTHACDILFQGKVHEAAAMYARAGAQDHAIAMYREMRMFRHDRVGMLYLTVLCEAYMLASFNSASAVCLHMQ
jgi:hypothetical protein